MSVEILLATPETDAALREEYYERGFQDAVNGQVNLSQSRYSGGMVAEWYREGWLAARKMHTYSDDPIFDVVTAYFLGDEE